MLLAVFGVVTLYSGRRLLLTYLLIGALGPPLFVIFYQIGDWQAYLAPAFVSLTALAASGLAEIGHRYGKSQTVATLIWLLAIGWNAVITYPTIKVDENPRDRSRSAVAGCFPSSTGP